MSDSPESPSDPAQQLRALLARARPPRRAGWKNRFKDHRAERSGKLEALEGLGEAFVQVIELAPAPALIARWNGAGDFTLVGYNRAATFVMGVGTAITVASIAVVAVSAKGLARRLSAGSEGGGTLIMRGIEFGAAGLVLLFGLGLLFGYLAAERATCL